MGETDPDGRSPLHHRGGPDRGVAVRDAARAGARGQVVSVHRKAIYLTLDGALIALVATGVEPGPLHLRVGSLPEALAGEPVRCDGSRITARWWAARCDVPVWEGTLPRHWSGVDGPGRSDDWSSRDGVPREVPVDPEDVLAAVRRGDVEALARLLGGRGPGLTPAGDDLLAGLLLVARARWGPGAEPRLVAAASSVATTGPAAAFLHWAARGQCLAPAHDVLVGLAHGDPVVAARAGLRLDAIGAGSGRCLHAGIRAGLSQLPRFDTQNVRAGPDAVL